MSQVENGAAQPTMPDLSQTVAGQEELTKEKQLQLLKHAHAFFAEFNGVPGKLAFQWSQALDAIALVANKLNQEIQ